MSILEKETRGYNWMNKSGAPFSSNAEEGGWFSTSPVLVRNLMSLGYVWLCHLESGPNFLLNLRDIEATLLTIGVKHIVALMTGHL